MLKTIQTFNEVKSVADSILVPFVLKERKDISLSIVVQELTLERENTIYSVPAVYDKNNKKILLSVKSIKKISDCLEVFTKSFACDVANDIIKQIKENDSYKPENALVLKVGGYDVRHLQILQEV